MIFMSSSLFSLNFSTCLWICNSCIFCCLFNLKSWTLILSCSLSSLLFIVTSTFGMLAKATSCIVLFFSFWVFHLLIASLCIISSFSSWISHSMCCSISHTLIPNSLEHLLIHSFSGKCPNAVLSLT
eukprot:NODE_832_length_3846_cov_0.252736.p4 type:complete len:127 gc:universal NODE_832_length_3846_cov_0.252736:1873-1493(-)